MRVLARTWQMLLKGIAEVAGRRPAAGGGRDGAGAARLCRRPADARRGDPLARRQRRGAGAARGRQRRHGLVRGGRARQRRGSSALARRRRRAAHRRAALASGSRWAIPSAAPAEATAPVAGRPQLRGADRARRREARPRGQDRARTRRAAGALRGRPARDRARAERRQDAGRRSFDASSREWTGRRWMVVVSRGGGAADGASRRSTPRRPSSRPACAADPLVQAVLARFPGAEIVDVRAPDQVAALPPADPDDDCRWNRRPPTTIPMVRTGCATRIREDVERWPISWA